MAHSLASIMLAIALTAAPATAQDQVAPGSIPWAVIEPSERKLLERLLESPHWPMRVFALMRLERYDGPEIEPLVRARLADEAWQARCFAIHTADRLGVAPAAADLEGENDARVLRAALRHGVALDDERMERIERGTKKLMRTRGLDDLLLGLEIAAASDVESLRREAERRLRVLFRGLDEPTLERISRRLARIVGEDPEPPTVVAWGEWFEAHGGVITLAPPADADADASAPKADPPLVATIDAEAFSRLLDYLGGLRNQDLDLTVVMDATMSMLPMITEARIGVESLILFLDDITRTMRLALIAYRDHDNEPVWEGERFTTDVEAIRTFLFDLRITGGLDLPEAVLEGLTACRELDWAPDATKQVVLVGDARPHDEDTYKIAELMDAFREHGILVHAVHVPMRMNQVMAAQLRPDVRAARQAEIDEHNRLTGPAFASIAERGGGEIVTLLDADELVQSIMHLTIEPAWWPAFDEFYALYLELCR